MGCGGSRTDALEPRYLESWTKETESTWLTGTDTDLPLSSIRGISSDGSVCEKNCSPIPDFFEDGLPTPAEAYLKVCSEGGLADARNDSARLDPPTPPMHEGAPLSSATTVQRTSVLHTEEIVTITVTQSIHQVDKNGKVKKSLTTYEVMKPAEAVK
ncbi:brain and acute leukemia cytoplasmic protein isoform X2 [Stigmatopora argus]